MPVVFSSLYHHQIIDQVLVQLGETHVLMLFKSGGGKMLYDSSGAKHMPISETARSYSR